ncbi:MAG: SAM-dependent DNA methyltransferase [Candidatus Kapabacteria bacterium]|nr:SAM-dependent DNA methyltransferase [Candidatus Kapabacteria bacterium]
MNHQLNEIIKLLNRDQSHSPSHLFRDLCRMSAISIHQSVAFVEQSEQEYLQRIRAYDARTANLFPEMFALIVDALETNPEQDFLGDVFEAGNMGNARSGQFFTPYPISRFMASITMGDIHAQLQHKPYITIGEPACGAGGMLIAARNEAVAQKVNLNTQVWMAATDIDRLCADMTYIQISLLGVAGVVFWGNSLAVQVWDTMVTPVHKLFAWDMRRTRPCSEPEQHEETTPETMQETFEALANAKGQYQMFG